MRAFRRALRRSYLPFYASFGAPNALQLAACGPILRGHNALLVAPTATGKTEAALAPVVERMLNMRPPAPAAELGLLYIAPTRALCREMAERLHQNLSLLDRKVRPRTGDSPTLPKPSPFGLCTTVESLDSLLARAPGTLATVRAVVLDEVHALHGNPRGDQLMVLLGRLDRATHRPAQRVALSATVSDPDEVVRRYLGSGELISGEGRRATRLRCVKDVEALAAAIREEGLRRVLCFALTRQAVEEGAAALRPLIGAGRVMVHHAGMSRRVRHEVEEALRASPVWVCVATSTLELGIDVGAIEAVALLDLPSDAATFQQRAGRAGRRDPVVRVLAVADTPARVREAEHLALLADKGRLDPTPTTIDPGVVVQQAFSLTFAHPSGVEPEHLADLLAPLAPKGDLKRIVEHLVSAGHLLRRRDRLCASQKVMDLGERGTLHANLPDLREAKVIDATTGRVIGQGQVATAHGSTFVLGGRTWQVQRAQKGKVEVVPSSGGAESGVKRPSASGPWTTYLPPDLRGGFPPEE